MTQDLERKLATAKSHRAAAVDACATVANRWKAALAADFPAAAKTLARDRVQANHEQVQKLDDAAVRAARQAVEGKAASAQALVETYAELISWPHDAPDLREALGRSQMWTAPDPAPIVMRTVQSLFAEIATVLIEHQVEVSTKGAEWRRVQGGAMTYTQLPELPTAQVELRRYAEAWAALWKADDLVRKAERELSKAQALSAWDD